VTVSRAFRRVVRGRFAVVGDASGSVDAITGEGLCLSFRQALALADAFAKDDLSLYQSAHRKMLGKPLISAALLLTLGRNRWLRRRVLRIFESDRELFTRLTAMHINDRPAPYFIRRSILPLTYQFLRGSQL